MSGAFSFTGLERNRYTWDLKEDPEQRKLRARKLRWVYAMCNPLGWDAHKLSPQFEQAQRRLSNGEVG